MNIPKILHYIWIGPYAKPRVSFVKTWMDTMGKDYEIILWTNDNPELKKYVVEAINLFGGLDKLSGYAMTYVCDMIRLLIIRDYGGIYMDHDIYVVQDITTLIDKHDLVLTYQHSPEDYEHNTVLPLGTGIHDLVRLGYHNIKYEHNSTINNCFVAATPGHKFIHDCIYETLINHYKPLEERIPMSDWTVGPYVFTSVLESHGHGDVKRSIPVDSDGVRVYERELLHPIRGFDRLTLGADAYEEKFQDIIRTRSSYAVHYCEHFGTSLYLNKKIITFSEWAENWLNRPTVYDNQ